MGGVSRMKRHVLLKVLNVLLPIMGIGLVIYYEVCDTACAYISGSLLGMDLSIVGISLMVVLLVSAIPPIASHETAVNHVRILLLAGAMGGEVLLVRFQIIHEVYCPFCLTFGLCILALFAVNFPRMNKYLALGAFLAGMGAFALFFQGFSLPLF